jgi:glycosyltransferase involved in cell wall biosynthesis
MGEQNSLVSVIIPTYNRANLVQRAIKSVLNQTYKNIEIIVVDDGSEDNTEEVVRAFNDERIKYIRNKENKGVAASRNIGLKFSKGEYITFLDSDDEFLPEKIEKQLKFLKQRGELDFVVCESCKKNENDEIKTRRKMHSLLQVLIKKDAFEKIGNFDENFYFADDTDILVRMEHFLKYDKINEILVIIHKTPGSLSSKKDFSSLIKKINDKKLIVKKYKNLLTASKIAHYYYAIGKDYLTLKNYLTACKYFIKSYILNPFNFEPIWKILRCFVFWVIKNDKNFICK